jgi:uncharacterized membrane protein YeiH
MLAAETLSATLGGHVLLAIFIAGAFVFALSGGLAAAQHELDLFGVVVLAAVVGLSGGILRDVMLGVPAIVVFDWRVVTSVVLAATVTYFFGNRLNHWSGSIEFFDAVGLALFCVIGTQLAWQHHAGPVAAVLMGVITAVGGGVVRDIILREIPSVLREGLYAVPALLGSILVVVSHVAHLDAPAWYAVAVAAALGLRLVGIVFHVNVPRARLHP